METSYLKTLELDKIIARAAEGCVCKEAREMLLATQPQCARTRCAMRWNDRCHQHPAD
mgnify:CR=1 FL=1